MNASSLQKLTKMHVLKAQLKTKARKKGQTLRKMEMLKAYSMRLKPPTPTTFPPSGR